MLCAWCSNQVPDAAAACSQCGVSADLSRDGAFREGLGSVQRVAERSRLRHPMRLMAGGIVVLAGWAAILLSGVEITAPVAIAAVALFPVAAVIVSSLVLSAVDADARAAGGARAAFRARAGVPLERCEDCGGSGTRRAPSAVAVALRDVDPEVHQFMTSPAELSKQHAACIACHGMGLAPRRGRA